jgi:hypothetical protein
VARALSARRPAVAPEAPRSDPAKLFLSRAVAKNKPFAAEFLSLAEENASFPLMEGEVMLGMSLVATGDFAKGHFRSR